MSNIPEDNQASKKAITANEERFRALVTATSDIVYIMSADWREMKQLDGRDFLVDTNEPLADWIPKYIHAFDQDKVRTAIEEARRETKIFQLEHRVLRADGTIGWTLSRAVPILDEQGNVREWFGAASDITEAKRAEEALKQAKEITEQQKRVYETITNNTPDLMYVFGLDYNFIYANEALLTMWGKSWENAIGKSLLENGYEPWHAEMHEREIDHVCATKKSIRGEVSFPHAVLGKRIYDYILSPVINEAGDVEAVAGTTRDITDIKQNEQRKNDFIGMVSHELKTPLTSLSAYLQLMEKNNPAQQDAMTKKILEQSVKQTRRMTNMINGFLNLARLESGKMFIESAPFELHTFLEEIAEETHMLYSQHRFVFPETGSVTVNGDTGKLAQVVNNLIGNAVKYSNLGSLITISAAVEVDELKISVTDQGTGIPQEEISSLFNRFYRGQNNNLIAGFGIGLYVCREIIEGHGGKIWVDSSAGNGSTFSFTFPISK
ncbi:PAS domain-containing sensor histidine kinase [Pedobacter sp. UBA5917]|jgi:PAS domain S-box-containing protein|uniref:PAS domain-containing sensor histidine kinase n=1 Tax=Pedobacter sp. UBA5917 TaxID=1947061 RepID=UPI0025F78AE3|nr:PAS domain-containing sensor histidine kinase [Pedobacter sp. UBA5917]